MIAQGDPEEDARTEAGKVVAVPGTSELEKYLSISLDKAERLEELINEFFEITQM